MMIDELMKSVCEKKNPCIIGLDPVWEMMPECFKDETRSQCDCILEWNKAIMDCIAENIVALKPQNAFYEVYGSEGVAVYEKTIAYAKSKGIFIIDDSKRGDIGNTAKAYAQAHLSPDGPIKADFTTISPFLGKDSMEPFITIAKEYDKGVFLLVRTTNPDAIELQDAKTAQGLTVTQSLAHYIHEISKDFVGECGYSSVGAVVAATYPGEAKILRKIMPNTLFLVPGFGEQGADVMDVLPCFGEDGLGALVSSSRGVLYAYRKETSYQGTKESYIQILKEQVVKMRDDVYDVLQKNCSRMAY